MHTPCSDDHYMALALEQARLGIGLTGVNPCVGAVIVYQDRILGQGYHQRAGGPHAERMAIADAVKNGFAELLPQATLYVTLEPCSTHGKTPPCTQALVDCGFKRVVFGSQDPNPKHAGVAVAILQAAGMAVTSGVLQAECDHLIRRFRLSITQQRPWIIAKIAMSLDGSITRSPHRPQWLTGPKARNFVHTLRAQCDAILVGGNTLRTDNPALTIRTPSHPVSPLKEQPWRIILTQHPQSLPKTATCFTDQYQDKTIVFQQIENYLELVQKLYRDRQIGTLMLECGGTLLRQFLQHRLVDEWFSFHAPLIVGSPQTAIEHGTFLPHEAVLQNPQFLPFDQDLCIHGDILYRE